MQIRLTTERIEIAAPWGCIQTFFVTPNSEIHRSTRISQCGKSICEYNYIKLLAIAIRLVAFLRKERLDDSDLVSEWQELCVIVNEKSEKQYSASGKAGLSPPQNEKSGIVTKLVFR